jgi:translation initiation factor IF-1
MVKNVTGGSKHRSAARKQTVPAAPPVVQWVRRAAQGELYASAAKNFGGCRVGVLCSDGKERICVIRRKFKRFRRGNDVTPGTYMLVGTREWETDSTTCDLLCVYSPGEVKLLMQDAAFKYDMLCVNEKKIEDVKAKEKITSTSGRDKAPARYIEDIMFDEDVASESDGEEAEEDEPLVAEQTKFSNVDKKKDDKSYDISAYLDGIDEEESESENEGECGEKDEFGNCV